MSRHSTPGEYVLGVSAEEAARLQLQHDLFGDRTRALWARAGLGPGATVLDLGCGPGFATAELAALIAPSGRVYAVDRSATYLAMARQTALRAGAAASAPIEFIEADAEQLARTPAIPPGAIDLAYCRYVLSYPRRPDLVVAALADKLRLPDHAAARRGGRIVIQDFYNYEFAPVLAPRSAIFDRVTRVVGESIRADGGDPDITGRLPRLLAAHGVTLTHIDCDQRLARPGSPQWAWRDAFYRNAVPRMVSLGRLTQAEGDEFARAWAQAAADPHAFVLGPVVVEIIGEKGPS